jgi:valyl-tRNA synthetase
MSGKQESIELGKHYDPAPTEKKWSEHWLQKRYFNSTPDSRPPFTVVIPPPNVTGVLHMGHTLNETVQDILVRRARMSGFNACWVPGSDHASIATEAKVVAMLRERGISKSSLTREQFLERAWEWREKYGNIIYSQIVKLGCSVDWNRVTFTMDPDYYKAVVEVFVDLYKKGLIYRDNRMVNWDPKAKTALSDEEVIYREVHGKLYFIKYKIQESDDYITIATVRPETILGDTAICVHPDDERYQHLVGKLALIPIIDRAIPIISDKYVDKEFGTGALKITPAHDMNDYQLGLKHRLDTVDILNDDGTMSDAANGYSGMDRFDARKKIVADLSALNSISKIEDYTHQVGFSERTDEIVEPALRLQWWVKMKSMSVPALKVVQDEKIKLYPSKFRNLYSHWMENIRDWCISRHLQWGHRIPAWYDEKGKIYVALNEEEAKKEYLKQNPGSKEPKLIQDEDVVDTWFSSWLWPMQVFKGISEPGNVDINYYYPTNTLVTAPEIIFFWVARMIMAGLEYEKKIPFSNVYFTGIVRDKQGRKMSKSLGNSPDLLELIDKYGADAVRFGIMISSPAGNDLLFDEAGLEQGRNFNNKIWNALKLVRSWESRVDSSKVETVSFAIGWFDARLNEVRAEIEDLFKEYKLSEALKSLYTLIWDDFCSWYLEWIKPELNVAISATIYHQTIQFFEKLMQMLHPFMPFITEEIYHLIRDRKDRDDLCMKQFDKIEMADKTTLSEGDFLKQLITEIRNIRAKLGLQSFQVYLSDERHLKFSELIRKNTRATMVEYSDSTVEGRISIVIGDHKIFIESEKSIDSSFQKDELLKEIEYHRGFLNSVNKKLNNEKFVRNAKPEVVALEQKKKSDAEAKIRALEESLAQMN